LLVNLNPAGRLAVSLFLDEQDRSSTTTRLLSAIGYPVLDFDDEWRECGCQDQSRWHR